MLGISKMEFNTENQLILDGCKNRKGIAEGAQRLITVGSSYCPLGWENKGKEVVMSEP